MVQLISPENSGKEVFLYNTEKREKEVFRPIDQSDGVRKVSFYSCGPTVYDYAHIGNFRAFLTYDILKRWLTYCGYEVEHVCNLTDVDDKIIVKMQSEGKSLKEITSLYANAFFDDLSVLNIIKAEKYPLATEHIGDIIEMISKLIASGHAYEKNGSVYFRVAAFTDYGKLANLHFDDKGATEGEDSSSSSSSRKEQSLEGGEGVGRGGGGPNEKKGREEKESARDFALWKAFVDSDGEVVWDSPFGKGRPGWHIECSAMCNCLLGKTIDIHAGGVDLVFPHHQNEVAQSEAYSGQKFCNYWIHNGFVNINNEKMSKSLKNFKTLRDVAKSPFDARAFRYMVVSAQYRSQLNFTPDTLIAAQQSLKRIDKVVSKLEKAAAAVSKEAGSTACDEEEEEEEGLLEETRRQVAAFEVAMLDDMNTPRASAALFRIVTTTEKLLKRSGGVGISTPAATEVLAALHRLDSVFGVLYVVPSVSGIEGEGVSYFSDSSAGAGGEEGPVPAENVPAEVSALALQRVEAKACKDWSRADELRAAIGAQGYAIKDVKATQEEEEGGGGGAAAMYEIYKT
jgi:cysteinyl-tRNA synthetase